MLAERMRHNRPAFERLVGTMLQIEQQRFEGRGVRWRRLAPSTVATDRRQGRDPRTLVLTGALRRSLTVKGAPGQVVRLGDDYLTFGTRIYYAQFHKRGAGIRGGGKLPRRNPVGATKAQRSLLVDGLREFLVHG